MSCFQHLGEEPGALPRPPAPERAERGAVLLSCHIRELCGGAVPAAGSPPAAAAGAGDPSSSRNRSGNNTMEEFLQRAKSRLDRCKHLEKVHTVIGNKCCDLDSIISTLTYAYYLEKIASHNVLCLPVLNVSRVEFNFYSETRFILKELDIPESFLIFRDEINLQRLNDEGRLSITLVNFSMLASEDGSLEASVVKVINPDKSAEMLHDSSSSLVAQEILEEAPDLVTRQLAHLLRGSILFSWLSVEHERIPAHQEDIVYALEERFPELPPREDIISCLQETKLHTQGVSIDEILLKDFKELSDGDIKVAISTIFMTLERREFIFCFLLSNIISLS
uniref:Uncharacterized protein n=1 Tax=Leptobrachium leishanense TaxID=445787 RepID=A0A8C5MVS6_9ANUR